MGTAHLQLSWLICWYSIDLIEYLIASYGVAYIKIDGELTKPATLLVKKISNAIGVIYEPTKIRRIAKASADAEKIKALNTIEVSEIEQRAINRIVQKEVRKQKNIEQITSKAIYSLPKNANIEGLEENWITHFFDKCENISDNEMQTVWSKLLCGEATSPGTYSKRTVNFISTIDKSDAELFTKFYKFIWVVGELNPLVFDIKNDIYTNSGINFASLKHLDSIGLISLEYMTGYIRERIPKVMEAFYYGRTLSIEFQNETDNQLGVGKVLLTETGMQLFNICGSEPSQEFYEYAVSQFVAQGLIVSSFVGMKAF